MKCDRVQTVPLGSVTIGAPSWRDLTVRSMKRAERLVRQTRPGAATAPSRPQTCSGSVTLPGSAQEEETTEEKSGTPEETTQDRSRLGRAPFPGSSFREACAGASVAVAGQYMRGVREVEGALRRQAGRVAQEAVRLERERELLEKTLRGLRSNLGINQRSAEQRTRRPATTETIYDGADDLLQYERRELTRLKQELEGTLSSTLAQIQSLSRGSGRLLDCASERARVLELLPLGGSGRSRGRATAQSWSTADPTSPYTPECKHALDSSRSSMRESQQLRETIRQRLSSALLRQRAAQQTVNDGLVNKVAETVSLQQALSMTCGATRQAMFRKQREIDCIRHSHGRAQGPESSADVLSREKLNRPLMQIYHRHPGTQLSEATHLIQVTISPTRPFPNSRVPWTPLTHPKIPSSNKN
uniref:Coiled-coil domain containing 105 n=1 Tax=Neogobius melanostomus TaxID=47308 RepID=A0A8C6ULY8_9GOBI